MLILDFDDTLIHTQTIEYLRKKRVWKDVYSNFYKTYLSDDVGKVFNSLANNPSVSMIIVTSSPRAYAKRLLSYHRFLKNIPIIGYHDTKKHKPETEPYEKALSISNEHEKVLVVGDSEKDIIPAKRLRLLTALALWYYDNRNTISPKYEPDYYLWHPSQIMDVIK